jgi:hypothetical protein
MAEGERAERVDAESSKGDDRQSRRAPFSDLDDRSQERLAEIMRVQVPEVFRATRVIEQETGYSSEIGKNMMVDVLSHLGTLAERGVGLDPEQQANQLAKIEEHLRRALIEHPEEVIRNRIVDVGERWLVYQREAYPYRQQGTLPNAPRHQELEEDRQRIQVLLEAARSKKPAETTWDETLTAAAEMSQAAKLTRELADKLEQCIGAAQERRRDDRRARNNVIRWTIGIIVSIALAGGAYLLGRSQDDSSTTSKQHQPAPPNTNQQHPAPPTKQPSGGQGTTP